MDSCDSSIEKFKFFDMAKPRFKTKLSVFETQAFFDSFQIKIMEFAYNYYMSSSLSSPWQRLICHFFCIDVLKLTNFCLLNSASA